MKISVVRNKTSEEGTQGILTTDAGFQCCTLELPWENNKSGVSCIITDDYDASIWFSPHLNREVLRLEDKHGRKDCLVHNGNFAGEGDGDVTQVHGCTEVGAGYGLVQRADGKTQFGITASITTLTKLINHVHDNTIRPDGGYDPVVVTYSWADGCEPEDLTDQNGG